MTDVRALKDEATQLLLKGKVPAALDAWKKVAAATPDDPTALQKVAELQAKLGKTADAVRTYEAVARGYVDKGLFFKASAVARLISTLEPGHTRTQELIAARFAKEQKPTPVAAPVVAAAPAVEPPPSTLPSIPLFSTLTQAELKDVLSHAMELRIMAPGDVVVTEGALGDSMYALAEGEAHVFRGWGTSAQRGVAKVNPGDVFGEAAMVSGGPRLATVVTRGDSVVLEFKREAMLQVISRFPRVGQMLDAFYRQRLLANVLRASPVFRALPDDEKQALASAFQPANFVAGQQIIVEGQPADSVHLLLRGSCTVTHASGEAYPELREGDLFGELSVLTGKPASASVAAAGPVQTLRITGAVFKAKVMADRDAAKAIDTVVQQRLARTAKLNAASYELDVDIDVDDLRV